MSKTKWVILATDGITTNLLYEQLSRLGEVTAVIMEKPERSSTKIRRRFKKLNFIHVLSQLVFLVTVSPVLHRIARKRIAEIVKSAGFKNDRIPVEKIIHVESVNDDKTAILIQQQNADFVFVNGTRIIRKFVLEKITIPILNLHVGITPQYRGIHGGYWALYHKDAANFGVTLHYVDAGVDTGLPIFQKRLQPSSKDNFASYPVLQYVAGLELIENYVNNNPAENGWKIEVIPAGRQYYHPAFFQYLVARTFRGIK